MTSVWLFKRPWEMTSQKNGNNINSSLKWALFLNLDHIGFKKNLPHTFHKYRLSNLYFEFLLFFKVGKFCFLGHLKVVSKLSFELRHPLYMICSIFRSKFDHSWQIKKKNTIQNWAQKFKAGNKACQKHDKRGFFNLFCGLFRKPQLYLPRIQTWCT